MATTAAKPSAKRCCGGHEYRTNGGKSSDYCPVGKTFLCAECATKAGAGRLCPTHKVRVTTQP